MAMMEIKSIRWEFRDPTSTFWLKKGLFYFPHYVGIMYTIKKDCMGIWHWKRFVDSPVEIYLFFKLRVLLNIFSLVCPGGVNCCRQFAIKTLNQVKKWSLFQGWAPYQGFFFPIILYIPAKHVAKAKQDLLLSTGSRQSPVILDLSMQYTSFLNFTPLPSDSLTFRLTHPDSPLAHTFQERTPHPRAFPWGPSCQEIYMPRSLM